LGATPFPSPRIVREERFVDEGARVLVCSTTDELEPFLASGETPPSFERAGPRRNLAFDPTELRCGVVSCGGLCPGINDVIRSVVLTLTHGYGVRTIVGFRYGYAGLAGGEGPDPIALTPELVEPIHRLGGTRLGSSRGPQPIATMVERVRRLGIGLLFAIGGDGTLRGASALARALAPYGVGVVAIPKTIDNDLDWIERSFGFATAVEEAGRALTAAHTEARGAYNGLGLLKLMGRHSGFITAHATLATGDGNFCLVPEVPFALHGKGGFFDELEVRLALRHHAVVAVAEGAGQELFADDLGSDASGNKRLGDIGVLLRDEIRRYFSERGTELTLKYIDPSYMIRSLPANAIDSEYCLALGQHAVHAGMAGRTDVMIGFWNRHFTHVPIALATRSRKRIDPRGALWQRVTGATGQGPLVPENHVVPPSGGEEEA
jgi:6-phosphofructokinase 1